MSTAENKAVKHEHILSGAIRQFWANHSSKAEFHDIENLFKNNEIAMLKVNITKTTNMILSGCIKRLK